MFRASEVVGAPLLQTQAQPAQSPILQHVNISAQIEAQAVDYHVRHTPDSYVDRAYAAARHDSSPAVRKPLDFTVRILLLGPMAGGKTELVNALLQREPGRATRGGTRSVRIERGSVPALQTVPLDSGATLTLEFIDTPGLAVSADQIAYNNSMLNKVKNVIARRKPHLTFYVERLDTHGLPTLQSQLTAMVRVLGPGFMDGLFLVYTHAHSAREALGRDGYAAAVNQRRQLAMQVARKSFGGMMQLGGGRMYVVDSHPDCPRDNSALQQPLVFLPPDNAPVAWRKELLKDCVAWGGVKMMLALLQPLMEKKQKEQQVRVVMTRCSSFDASLSCSCLFISLSLLFVFISFYLRLRLCSFNRPPPCCTLKTLPGLCVCVRPSWLRRTR